MQMVAQSRTILSCRCAPATREHCSRREHLRTWVLLKADAARPQALLEELCPPGCVVL